MRINRLTNKTLSQVALCFLIISIYACVDFPIIMNISQVFFGGVAGYIAISQNIPKTPIVKFYFMWGGIWIIYCFMSIVWSVNPDSSLSYCYSVIQVVLIGFCFCIMISKFNMNRIFEHSIILAAVVLIIRLVLVTPINEWGTDRLGLHLGIQVNTIACNVLFAELFSFIEYQRTKHRKFLFLTILFLFIVFLCASKKSVIMGSVMPIFIYMIYMEDEKKSIKLLWKYIIGAIFIVFIAIAVVRIPMIYNVVSYRMEGFINFLSGKGKIDTSTQERVLLAQAARSVFWENPLFGVGLNGFRFASGLIFRGNQLYAHNNYLELLADLGIIGLFIYYSIYIAIFINGKRYINDVYIKSLLLMTLMILVMDYARVTYLSESIQLLVVYIFSNSIKGVKYE